MKNLISAILKSIKSDVDNFCNLESTMDDNTFITRYGGYLNFFEIKGAFESTGKSFRDKTLDQISERLEGILKQEGHRISFFFIKDKSQSYVDLKDIISEQKKTAARLKLDLNSIIDQSADILKNNTVFRRCYMVVETMPIALNKHQIKKAYSQRADEAKKDKVGIKSGDYCQNPTLQLKPLLSLHNAFTKSLLSVIGEFIVINDLNAQESLNVTSNFITNSHDQSREFSLPGKKIPIRNKESYLKEDYSHLLYPLISHQLFHEQPQLSNTDGSACEIAGRKESTVVLDLQQQNITQFKDLEKSISEETPYRACLTIETGHDKIHRKIQGKHTKSSILYLAGAVNKSIMNAANEIMSMVENNGHILNNAQFMVTTWADSEPELTKQKYEIIKSIEAWGNTSVYVEQGNPIQASLDTVPGFTGQKIAPQLPMVLDDALDMLPTFFTSSPWTYGPVKYRTLDKSLYMYSEGSSLQPAFNRITFARPGSGKSVQLSIVNTGLILTPGLRKLPRITCIDIGQSSGLWAKFIQNALPDEEKDQVAHYKVEMTPSNATNPFDTLLGCYRPLSVDRTFLINFLTIVLTPAGASEPPARLSEFLSLLVDEMYDFYAPDNNPKPYEPGINETVDAALEACGIEPDEDMTWWEIQDNLFDNNKIKESQIAQRYAVPVLNDATTVISSSNNIKDSYGAATINGEPIINFAKSMLNTAVSDYPIISQPTMFDIGNARIVSIDLASVAQKGSASATKQTCIVYMLARFFGCKGFYFSKENIEEVNEKYQEYHQELLRSEEGIPKKICMDEYHRTDFNDPDKNPVRIQTVVDQREGRKHYVFVDVISQLDKDFTNDMLEQANNICIMSKSLSSDATNKIIKKYNMSPDVSKEYLNSVTGPGSNGSTMIFIADVTPKNLRDSNKTRIETALNLLASPAELWAISTTKQDNTLMSRLMEKTGSLSKSISILAREFPGGSAKSYIESYKQQNESVDIFEEITSNLIEKYTDTL